MQPTIPDRFLSTTGLHIFAKRQNMLDKAHPFYECTKSMALDKADGGHQATLPWHVQRHSSTTQLSNGYEALNLNVQPILKSALDEWFYAQRPIVISGRDEMENSGKNAVVKLLEGRIKDSQMGLIAEFDEHSLRGGVAAMSDLNTFNGVDVATGAIEEDAVGSQANTIHGISKALYSTLPGFQNQRANLGASFSTNGINSMYAAETSINDILHEEHDEVKRVGFLSLNGTNYLKRAMSSKEVYQAGPDQALGEKAFNAGVRPIRFGAYDLYTTSVLPNTAYGNSQNWTVFYPDFNAARFIVMKGLFFKMSKFEGISGHDARAAFISIFGQWMFPGLGTHFLGYNGETY